MTHEIILSGIHGKELYGDLQNDLERIKPKAIGIISAFVSVLGVELFMDITKKITDVECRLIAGLDLMITHPNALRNAQQAGWLVHIGKAGQGIFHPKMIITGDNFQKIGLLKNSGFAYIGSSNLTKPGLISNLECGITHEASKNLNEFSNVFFSLWKNSIDLTEELLSAYTEKFIKFHRKTKPETYSGIVEPENFLKIKPEDFHKKKGKKYPVITKGTQAVAVWSSLESFTGEYTFQLEFPRMAGQIINQLIKESPKKNRKVAVSCEDEKIRKMVYKFYEDNSMFRLNIPNDVPTIEWVRNNKKGIAIIERTKVPSAPFSLKILEPGEEANEIMERSYMLDTWGITSTRLYGWF